MFYRSAVQEHQRLERLIGQELDELTASIDRDIERRTAVLQTLATAPALASEDWPAFYAPGQGEPRPELSRADRRGGGRQLVNTFVPHGEAPAFTGDPATIEDMRRTMRPVVSDLFTSLVAKRPVYNISIPIAGDGGLRYVMSLGLLPEDLLGLLQRSASRGRLDDRDLGPQRHDHGGIRATRSGGSARRCRTIGARSRTASVVEDRSLDGRAHAGGFAAGWHWPAGRCASPFPRGWSTPRPASCCGCGERRRRW